MDSNSYSVITENDVSVWADETGVLYHFPKRYLNLLKPQTKVIYYKGKLKHSRFRLTRLSNEPHYFGFAIIDKIYPDKSSKKGDFFATLKNFTPFSKAVMAKKNGSFIEIIPESRKTNYWRDGVREINEQIYEAIIELADTPPNHTLLNMEGNLNDREISLISATEGNKKKRYVTTYERDKRLRAVAIAMHGFSCSVCGFNFEKVYGEYAKGYIQVHHVVPISERPSDDIVNPETDLVPVCANCHVIIHRRKDDTKSISDMKEMMSSAHKEANK